MKKLLLNLSSSLAMLSMTLMSLAVPSQASAQAGGGEEFKPLGITSAAFIKVNNDMSPDEAGAYETFAECYPQALPALPCGEFSAEWAEDNGIKAIWIHINRPGVEIGWHNLPDGFADEAFIQRLREYSVGGGKMFLSGLATQLLVAIGRQPDAYAPNIYYTDSEGRKISGNMSVVLNDNDPWGVTGRLNGVDHDGINSFGHAKHAIYGQPDPDFRGYYASLTSTDDLSPDGVHYKWNILGAYEGQKINVSDNNCMGTYDDRAEFRRRNNCQIPGSWGQENYDTRNWGIVEFLPDNVDGISGGHDVFGTEDEPWMGNTIANGMACFQYANKADNRYYDNLRNLTFNTINYLTGEYRVIPSGITAVGDDEAAAEAPVYYNMQGIRVEAPAAGELVVKVAGGCATKMIAR